MDLWLILSNAIALVVYMTIVFAVARRRNRIDTVDGAWGGGFVVVAWLVAGLQLQFRTVLIAILIDIWAIRLTNHILQRSAKRDDDDPRYTEIATKWGKRNKWPRAYVSIFLVQAIAVLIVSLPTVFAAGQSIALAPLFTAAGVIIWIAGFATEAAGDYQLKQFIADKKNKGKVLDTGLWHYSRHPNYLGEITQWYGIAVIACASSWGWLGLIGPIILNILIRYVSGVPPIENRKKKDKDYAAYMEKTNALFPRLWRKS